MRRLCRLSFLTFLTIGIGGSGLSVAQQQTTALDIEKLTSSFNFGSEADRSLLGVTNSLLASLNIGPSARDAIFSSVKPIILAQDGQSATLSLLFPEVRGTVFDGASSLQPTILFEQVSDAEYSFVVNGLPTTIAPDNERLLSEGQGIVLQDPVIEGVWNADVRSVSELRLSLGGFEATIDGTKINGDGFDYYAGAFANYQGTADVTLDGLDRTTAQVSLGEIGRIEFQSGDSDDTIKAFWDGVTLETAIGAPLGSGLVVPNILYGTPEIHEANQRLLALSNDIDDLADLSFVESFSSVANDLITVLEASIGFSSHTSIQGLPAQIEIGSRYGPDLSFISDGFEIYGSATAQLPSDSVFMIRTLPLEFNLDDAKVSIGEIAIKSESFAVDLPALFTQFDALMTGEGTWGHLTGLALKFFDGFASSYSIKGFTISESLLRQGAAMLALPNDAPAADPVAAGLSVGELYGDLRLNGLQDPDGATLKLEIGLAGFDLAPTLIPQGAVGSEYFEDRDDNGIIDLWPSDTTAQVAISGLPFTQWQAVFDGLPRSLPMSDGRFFDQAGSMLGAVSLQLLTPLLTSPPRLSMSIGVDSELAGVGLDAEYAINPMAGASFGEGTGTVVIKNGDKFLQRLFVINKLVKSKLDDGTYRSRSDVDFYETATWLADALKVLRSKRISVEDDWIFDITSDPEAVALINGLPLAEFSALLAD